MKTAHVQNHLIVLEIEVLFLSTEQVQWQENDPYSIHQDVLYEYRICRQCKNKGLYVSLPMNKQKAIKVRKHRVIVEFVLAICKST